MQIFKFRLLDNSFGKNGKSYISFPDISVIINAIAFQKSQKIILAGFQNSHIFLARLNKNGSLDSSFGINGIVKYDSVMLDVLFSIKIQDDDKIVTAGLGEGGSFGVANVFELHRFTPDGLIDKTFGNNGNVASHLAMAMMQQVTWLFKPTAK